MFFAAQRFSGVFAVRRSAVSSKNFPGKEAIPLLPDESILCLKGVGPALAKKFEKLGILTLEDAVHYYPRDYVDLTHPYPVADAPYDTACVVKATVWSIGALRRIPGGRTLLKVNAGDDTAGLVLTYFNNPYAANALKPEQEYYFFGKFGGKMTQREIANPTVIPVAPDSEPGLLPVYPQTAGLASRTIGRYIRAALDAVQDALSDPLPEELVKKYRLGTLAEALHAIHAPTDPEAARLARRRLAFQELYLLQLGLCQMRGRSRAVSGAHIVGGDLREFFTSLPFTPTGAQQRAIADIRLDLAGESPMNRLLQGDVGSGKTLVAAAGMLLAAQSGYQSVLMAPTEILARQHAATLEKLLAPLGLQVVLLTGAVKGRQRTAALHAIADGDAQLIVGTHAVLGEQVRFADLGFVVTDEQHRFGVRQRAALAAKANHPHILVMSATPIPRTLGLLLYGDLDISILDELPPGRKPVRTYAVGTDLRARMFGFIEKQLAAGRQAYLVCPVIEEGQSELQSVTEYLEQVAQPLLPGRRIGLMHGRLKPTEKTEVMRQFAAHELDVLCSTTVIEVGVDVPNANTMVIENAERYGLSALHQLRGRVGRGAAESYCILVSDHDGEDARRRLEFLCSTTDGFAIAQFDLDTRGPGDFFGSRQHGLPALRTADLMRDARMLEYARSEAHALLATDPTLEAHPALKAAVQKLFADDGSMN